MKILHTYTDQRPQDQIETLEQLAFIASRYPVDSQKMIEPDDYWAFLLRNWNKSDDLIIIEQDVVPTLAKVHEIRECPQPVCAFPFRLPNGEYSVFDLPNDGIASFHEYIPLFYPAKDELDLPSYTNGTALGFTKISERAQKQIPLHQYPVDKYHWWYLDSFISWWLRRKGYLVHVHTGEVKHNRTVEITFNIGNHSIVLDNK